MDKGTKRAADDMDLDVTFDLGADKKKRASMRRLQVWINPWITNVTAEAFKLARLCLDNGWLYAAHVQTWKGELLVQLCQPGR